jgi:hypothetical protein
LGGLATPPGAGALSRSLIPGTGRAPKATGVPATPVNYESVAAASSHAYLRLAILRRGQKIRILDAWAPRPRSQPGGVDLGSQSLVYRTFPRITMLGIDKVDELADICIMDKKGLS